MSDSNHIVVGVEGSHASELAVDWAADEADSRGCRLRIVGVYDWELVDPWELTFRIEPRELGALRRQTEKLVASMAGRARDRVSGIEVETAAVQGDPLTVLAAESAAARLVVVGSRHLHSLGMRFLGSVASGLVPLVSCPLVVLRGPAGDPAELAKVLVGIDGGPGSDELMAFAMDHAERHGAEVHAVLVWRPDVLREIGARRQPPAPEQAERWLAEAVSGWREKFPDVRLYTSVIRDHPVGGLVDLSTAHHLLVVGRRRHGPAPFGNTARGVLHHASVPVAIVPVPES